METKSMHNMNELIGKTIKGIRPLTLNEKRILGFHDEADGVVIIFTDGYMLLPVADYEMNGLGRVAIFKGGQMSGMM